MSLFASPGTGLELSHPETLQLVYAIEPANIEANAVQSIITNSLANSGVQLGQREDAQLHLRIEEHSGRYLLYLDFSREVHYHVDSQCYSKAGFVWGRYAKDIVDIEQLHEDIQFLFDEFLDNYLKANSKDL